MTHDSRRYHRVRRPTFTRAYGALGALGGALETAGTTALSGLETAGGAALSGLESVGTGLQSLFGGTGGGEAGYLASLGQAVPEGVEMVGPSSTFTGPGFLSSVSQGFISGPQQFANPSAGTRIGQGVGGLLRALDQIQGTGGGHQVQMGQFAPHRMGQQIVRGIGNQVMGPKPVVPGGQSQVAQGPVMKLLSII